MSKIRKDIKDNLKNKPYLAEKREEYALEKLKLDNIKKTITFFRVNII